MPNPLWVDTRDYLVSNNIPITTANLNQYMTVLAGRPDLRPSYAKMSPDASTSIAAGLGAPTNQIVSTPLPPPPISNSPKASTGGGGRGGASGKTNPASPPTAKSAPVESKRKPPVPVAKPRTVNAEDAVTTNGDPLQNIPMGGYTPSTTPATTGSPVSPAQAATASPADNSSGNGTRLAVGAVGAAGLLAALLGMRGGRSGMRPREMPGLEGEVLPPEANPNIPQITAKPTIEGNVPANAPGDPIQQLLGSPAPPRQTYYGDGNGDVVGDNSPVYNNNQVVPSNSIPMPNETSGPAITPPTLEDIIASLTNQTPAGQSPAGPNLPSGTPAPSGKPMRNVVGTKRGTQTPYTGQTPTNTMNPIEILMHLMGVDSSSIGGAR